MHTLTCVVKWHTKGEGSLSLSDAVKVHTLTWVVKWYTSGEGSSSLSDAVKVYTLAPAAMFSRIWIGSLGAVKCGPFNTSVYLNCLLFKSNIWLYTLYYCIKIMLRRTILEIVIKQWFKTTICFTKYWKGLLYDRYWQNVHRIIPYDNL